MNTKIILKGIVIIFLLIFIVRGESNNNKISGRNTHQPEFESFSSFLNNNYGTISEIQKAESWINYFMRRWEIKGASVAIMKNNKLVYVQGFGFADVENEIEMQPFHLMRIASVSKLVTAVGIMKLVEDEKLNLNDKVFGAEGILNDEKYSNYIDNRVEEITINQLLTHTAGWSTRWGDHLFMSRSIANYLDIQSPVSEENIIEFALSKKMHFQPGKWYSYTNIAYLILGEVIEKVTDNSYEDYINASVLFPLGIYNMHIGGNLPFEKLENEVKYYEQSNVDSVKSIYNPEKIVLRSYGGTDIKTLGSAGGWISSPANILKLVAAIDRNSGCFDMLSEESINIMSNNKRKSYPVGWRGSDGNDTWWRTGSLAGTSALVVHQNDSISYAIFTNTSSWKGSDFTRELNLLMKRVVKSVDKWPHRDLFLVNKKADLFSSN